MAEWWSGDFDRICGCRGSCSSSPVGKLGMVAAAAVWAAVSTPPASSAFRAARDASCSASRLERWMPMNSWGVAVHVFRHHGNQANAENH